MTENLDLDPQEAIEQDYNQETDIDTEKEIAEPTTPQDEEYKPEGFEFDGDAFDPDGWPGDELVVMDLDGIDEEDDEEEGDE